MFKKLLFLSIVAVSTCLTHSDHPNLSFLSDPSIGKPFLEHVTALIRDKVATHSKYSLGGITDWIECKACSGAVSGLDAAIKTSIIKDAIEAFGVIVCNQIEKHNNTVCPGAVKAMGDVIVPSMVNLLFSSDYICSRALQVCGDKFRELSDLDYVHRILSDKPETIRANDYIDKLYADIKNQPDRSTFKAVHFSDAHVDLKYTPGTNAKCNLPLCCRAENGIPADPANAAG